MTFQNNTEIKSASNMVDGLIMQLVERAKAHSKEHGEIAERRSKELLKRLEERK